MDFAGRVHCDLSEQEVIIQGLKARCDSIIVYRHEDTLHHHIHFLMKGVTVSYDTLVNVVKRAIPGAKKDKYSFKTGANDDFISYMSRGKLDPVFNQGFSEDIVKEKKSKGYDKNVISNSNLQTVATQIQQPKVKQKTQYELVREIACRFIDTTNGDDSYNYDVLYECTVDILKANMKGGDIFYVMKTMESVIMHQFPNAHRQFVKTAWLSRHKLNF